ncbi:hypothetical protein [Niabella ginsengisoli]|uniref:CCDC81-like prokaryotic HU domain-containing protein n=1 Tax=Niabella ginsengisoli TaxID=522298 RepID=A0ABS9SF62_9BACT|nr:hypothetical protein [Niabella ginsengisoli]MCH5597001.1 hypothetical protein [Niabella ginsengisoli]
MRTHHNQLFVKLAPILTQYLTANKTLSLPGLGTFHADSAYDPEVDYSKKGTSLLSIRFEQEKISEVDDDLVEYVSTQTGKMKVLAKSDLMSELDAVINFLNTGKPYFISGIGTVTKKSDGTLEFHKEKYQQTERRKAAPITEKNFIPQAYIDETRKPRRTRPAAIITILCLLAIAATVWFYVKNSDDNAGAIEESTAHNDGAVTDSAQSPRPSSTSLNPQSAADKPASYKYILEITREPRASKRFSQLKNINWPVEIETADSVNYALFIKLPAANADTTKVKDSLSVLSGRRVWIER